ncbi:hypothetical protein ACS0TY_025429 [Phlomoides rotata]
MSWLARSIADSLRLDDEDADAAAEEENDEKKTAVSRLAPNDAVLREDRPRESTEDNRLADRDGYASGGDEDIDGDYDQGRGVREDLSELKDSLTRQFWGVATFLAPPPPPPPLPPPPYSRRSDSSHVQLNSESKSDVAVSGNADEEEYYERESDQFGESENLRQSDEYNGNILEEAIGITEEALAFARNIAHHPETWLDFPLSEEEDFDDFGVSDAQYKHLLAIEHLAPRLAALRYELCPVHMSEDYFWMVYFVLLHSRLNKHDADLLSSPQLVQARAMWMQELQKRAKEESHWLGMSSFHSRDSTDSPRKNFITHAYEDTHFVHDSMHQATAEHEIEKHSLDEVEFIDKSVIKEDPPPELQDKEIVVGSSFRMPVVEDDDDDEDDWLKDDSDLIGYTSTTIVVNEDDISFSDLEDDLDCTMPIKHTTPSTGRNITTNTS